MNTIIHTIEPVNIKDNTYIYSMEFHSNKEVNEVNDKDSEFKVGDHVRFSKYENIFPKGYTPNWCEDVFVIKKVKNAFPWTYVLNNLNHDEIIGTRTTKDQSARI